MRKLLGAGAVVLIVAASVAAGRLWSQDKMPPAAPDTRIRLINLTYVISNCNKYKAYKEEIKAGSQPYEDRIRKLQGEVETLKKEAAGTDVPAPRRAEIDKTLIQLQADVGTANLDAKTLLAPKASEEMVALYKDVQSACNRYAKAHDLDLVMHYNEPLDPNDFYSPANVERKLGAGALIPLYWADGMDISKEILEILNEPR